MKSKNQIERERQARAFFDSLYMVGMNSDMTKEEKRLYRYRPLEMLKEYRKYLINTCDFEFQYDDLVNEIDSILES